MLLCQCNIFISQSKTNLGSHETHMLNSKVLHVIKMKTLPNLENLGQIHRIKFVFLVLVLMHICVKYEDSMVTHIEQDWFTNKKN